MQQECVNLRPSRKPNQYPRLLISHDLLQASCRRPAPVAGKGSSNSKFDRSDLSNMVQCRITAPTLNRTKTPIWEYRSPRILKASPTYFGSLSLLSMSETPEFSERPARLHHYELATPNGVFGGGPLPGRWSDECQLAFTNRANCQNPEQRRYLFEIAHQVSLTPITTAVAVSSLVHRPYSFRDPAIVMSDLGLSGDTINSIGQTNNPCRASWRLCTTRGRPNRAAYRDLWLQGQT